MGIKRVIVDTGEKVSHFFANDLQNHYYKYLFISNAKKYIGKKKIEKDSEYERQCKEYWKKNTGKRINTIWHDYYSTCNGIKDVRYIPENLYYAYIEPFYNRKSFCECCDDKCFYSERFPMDAWTGEFKRPETILRNISGLFYDKGFNVLKFDKAVDLISSIDTGYVIKESITGTGGNRITFVEPGIRKTKEEITSVFLHYKKDFIIESIIEQCEELKYFNSSSINTIRFITYLDDNGVHLLSSVLRIGGANSRTDNFSTGGIACGITEGGSLKSIGFDQHYNKYTNTHPNGVEFTGRMIPGYTEAKELVMCLHHRFGHFRIISWDIAIGEDYCPILIEFNLTPQSIDLHQINNGPLFGELTDKILLEVFGR